MDICQLANLLRNETQGLVKTAEPLARHTAWRIGGPAELFYRPLATEDCLKALRWAARHEIPVTIIGNGTNLLVADHGIGGLVIQTTALQSTKWEDSQILAEGGILLPKLCSQAAERGLTGLEFGAGIPGTLGGAVKMNAGAHGSAMEQLVVSVQTVTKNGEVRTYSNQEMGFQYRSSILKNGHELIIEARLALRQGERAEIKRSTAEYLRLRREKQPLNLPNAGSVFKNPVGYAAGSLIEGAGLKGLRAGNAQVSEVHANFIVNLGGATAADVLTLIGEVQNAVQKKYAVWLETEVVFLGFDSKRR